MPLSGNPGYLQGAPLLMATLAPSGAAVTRRAGGVPLLATTADGGCAAAGGAAAAGAMPPVAAFDVGGRAACALRLSLDELRALCNAGTNGAWRGSVGQLAAHFAGLPAEAWYVGVWGNSREDALSDWVRASVEEPSAFTNWNRPSHLLRAFFLSECSTRLSLGV